MRRLAGPFVIGALGTILAVRGTLPSPTTPDAALALGPVRLDSAASRLLFRSGFATLTVGTSWADGSVHGSWRDVYGGYGHVGIVRRGASRVLQEQPRASTRPDETHATMVVSRRSFGSLDLSVWVRTVRQLRTPTPNPWEVAWVVWHYRDDTHFYDLVLKANGWELGKEDPAYPGAQRFLATGSSPTFAPGRWYLVRVLQAGDHITVWVNGARLVSVTDGQRPYLRGSLGLYTEDAQVQFGHVRVRWP